MARKYITEKTTSLDQSTGEISDTYKVTTISTITDREPDYIKLYLQDLSTLHQLPRSSSSILFEIVKRVDYKNRVYIVSTVRREICEAVGIEDNAVTKTIKILVDREILIRVAKGLYLINPKWFGRGSWKDIQAIKLEIDYKKGKNNRTLKPTFE